MTSELITGLIFVGFEMCYLNKCLFHVISVSIHEWFHLDNLQSSSRSSHLLSSNNRIFPWYGLFLSIHELRTLVTPISMRYSGIVVVLLVIMYNFIMSRYDV